VQRRFIATGVGDQSFAAARGSAATNGSKALTREQTVTQFARNVKNTLRRTRA